MALSPNYFNLILGGLLLGAVYTDLRYRKIPNFLVGIGMLAALGWHFYQSGMVGLFFSLQGLGIGILLLAIPFFLGGMGAGDVKLLGMIGAFMGTQFVFNTFIWMALVGGVVAMIFLMKEGQVKSTLSRLGRGALLAMTLRKGDIALNSAKKEEFSVYFPYGLAIVLGALLAYWRSW
ncbi:MAG: prepilin peptidase [Chitinophagales bacterium]